MLCHLGFVFSERQQDSSHRIIFLDVALHQAGLCTRLGHRTFHSAQKHLSSALYNGSNLFKDQPNTTSRSFPRFAVSVIHSPHKDYLHNICDSALNLIADCTFPTVATIFEQHPQARVDQARVLSAHL